MNTNTFLDLSNNLNINLINLDSFNIFLQDNNISFNTLPISISDMLVVINTSPTQCAAIFKSYDSPTEDNDSSFIPKFIYVLDEEFKHSLAIKYHKNKDCTNAIIKFLDSPNLLNTNNWLTNWDIGNRSFASISKEDLLSFDDFERLSFVYEGDFQYFEELNYLFVKVNNKLLFTKPIILNNPFSEDELIFIDLALFEKLDDFSLNDIYTHVAEADLIAKDFQLVFKNLA